MPGRRGVHQVKAASGLQSLKGGDHRLHRHPTGRRSEHARHRGVGFERCDLNASRGEQTGRLSGAGTNLQRRTHGPSCVAHHRVDDLAGVVQPVALVQLRNRPERQPPDTLSGSLIRLAVHSPGILPPRTSPNTYRVRNLWDVLERKRAARKPNVHGTCSRRRRDRSARRPCRAGSGSADSGGHRNRSSPISSIGLRKASRFRGRSLSS